MGAKFLMMAGMMAAAMAMGGHSQAQSYDPLSRCIGSKNSVLSCCAQTKKPRWWWADSASCRSAISCYPVTLSNGKVAEECRIRRRNGLPF